MLKGFKNFLMRGDVIVVAVGLVVALAFSGLILAFTTDIISPIVATFQGGSSNGLGVQWARTTTLRRSWISSPLSRNYLLHHLHCRRVLPHRRAVQGGSGPPRAGGLR